MKRKVPNEIEILISQLENAGSVDEKVKIVLSASREAIARVYREFGNFQSTYFQFLEALSFARKEKRGRVPEEPSCEDVQNWVGYEYGNADINARYSVTFKDRTSCHNFDLWADTTYFYFLRPSDLVVFYDNPRFNDSRVIAPPPEARISVYDLRKPIKLQRMDSSVYHRKPTIIQQVLCSKAKADRVITSYCFYEKKFGLLPYSKLIPECEKNNDEYDGSSHFYSEGFEYSHLSFIIYAGGGEDVFGDGEACQFVNKVLEQIESLSKINQAEHFLGDIDGPLLVYGKKSVDDNRLMLDQTDSVP